MLANIDISYLATVNSSSILPPFPSSGSAGLSSAAALFFVMTVPTYIVDVTMDTKVWYLRLMKLIIKDNFVG